MTELCRCVNTATRNKVAITKNRCKICGLPYRLDHLYQNSTGIEQKFSPVYTNTFEGEQSFANYDEFENNCSCDTPQGTGEFCSFLEG